MNNYKPWIYGNLVLRIFLGFFLFLWGVDKLIAPEDTIKIFSHFYKMPIDSSVAAMVGAFEIALGWAIMLGYRRKMTYLMGFIVHLVSTLSSWKQLLDPWGKFWLEGKNSHLFLASIPVLAAFLVLYANREDDRFTFDHERCKGCKAKNPS